MECLMITTKTALEKESCWASSDFQPLRKENHQQGERRQQANPPLACRCHKRPRWGSTPQEARQLWGGLMTCQCNQQAFSNKAPPAGMRDNSMSVSHWPPGGGPPARDDYSQSVMVQLSLKVTILSRHISKRQWSNPAADVRLILNWPSQQWALAALKTGIFQSLSKGYNE